MDTVDINSLLDRDENATHMMELLKDFELKKHDLATKRGIYIYGEPGSGKTTFVTNILKQMNYDIIK